jgi:hypothetical protein
VAPPAAPAAARRAARIAAGPLELARAAPVQLWR